MKPAHWIFALLTIGGVLAGSLVYALAIAGLERHSGYFAPVWDGPGKGIYFIQRDTQGSVRGMGWEHFSPPASTNIKSDEFSLRYLDAQTGEVEVLQSWSGSPLMGRTTKHYRGRIFNSLWVRIDPSDGAVDFVIRMNIPRVPRSEVWFQSGTWRRDAPAQPVWTGKHHNHAGINDAVLTNDLEVMAVPGPESFPAAIITIDAEGNHRVLLKSAEFDAFYPDGIPVRRIAERSHREMIERGRTLKQARTRLVAKHLAAGLNEGAAKLQASEDLEEMGLMPKRPRLVAQSIDGAPDGEKVFDIPPEYFKVGLFQDIAAAIARPGDLVDTGTGTYLKYYDDDVGVRLRAWRQDGNDRFTIRTDGKLYRLEVRRFDN